jgi:DHA2 family multidrug resistance protein
MMYVLGVVMYGTTVLLPILLQTVMGYTAMRSGFVLLPGGMVLLIMLPFVGFLLGRVEPRWVVVFGLVLMAVGLFDLSHFTLQSGMQTAVNDWIVSRAGTAFLFVPINVMAFSFVPSDKINNATGFINLARNIGGSMGISFVTTMLDRRAQFHQSVLAGNVRAGNFDFQMALHRLTHLLTSRGLDAPHAVVEAYGMVYQQLQRQAMMLSFVDNFWLMAMICLCVIPLLFIMRKPKPNAGRVPIH